MLVKQVFIYFWFANLSLMSPFVYPKNNPAVFPLPNVGKLLGAPFKKNKIKLLGAPMSVFG